MPPDVIDNVFSLLIGFAVAGALASGYQAMRRRPAGFGLLQQGVVPGKDYKVLFSGQHDQSILGVASGDYDAAAVASDVFDRMVARGAVKADDFRVLYRSDAFPTSSFAHAHGVKTGIAFQLFGASNLQLAYDLIDDDTGDPVPEMERRLHVLLDGNGFDVLEHIRRETNIPALFVTAATAVSDRVAGLDRGADDYLLKPFSPGELVARVDAALRRRSGLAR